MNGTLGAGNTIANNQGTAFSTPLQIRTGGTNFDTLNLQSFIGGAGVGVTSPNANANLFIGGKGSGATVMTGNGKNILSVYGPADAALGFSMYSAASGGYPTLQGVGTDTHVPLLLAGQGASGVLSVLHTFSRDPTTTDVPYNTCADWLNSSTGTKRRYCNFAGGLNWVTYSND